MDLTMFNQIIQDSYKLVLVLIEISFPIALILFICERLVQMFISFVQGDRVRWK